MKIVRQLHKAFPTPDPSTVKQLYTVLIRTITEYASVACPPSLTANITMLEDVQRRAIRWGRLRNCHYAARLATLGLQKVSDRRARGDCIQMFKHFTEAQEIPWVKPLCVPERSNRGHNRKYRAEQATYQTHASRYDFLPNRVAERWNQLPDSIVNAASVNAFKNEYDKHFPPPARSVPPTARREPP
jgi:hypothetical protein